MKRREEIQWEAGGIVNRMVQRGVSQDYDTYYQAFQDGARWADKTMVEKACQWMEENLREVHPRTGKEVCIVNLNCFREAMEE